MTPTSFAILLVFIAVSSALALLWRRALVMVLPFLVTLDGVSFRLAGSSVRADQIAACMLLVPLAASVLLGTRRLRVDGTAYWLAAIMALNVASSALHSPAPSYSIAQCANLASEWIIYVLLINYLDTRRDLELFTSNTLWAAILAGVVGIGAFALAVGGLNIGGAEVSVVAAERLTRPFGAYGTLLEPNLFGSFTGPYLVLSVGLLLVSAEQRSETTSLTLLRRVAVVSAIGLVLSFTRAAWIGAIGGVAWFVFLGVRAIAVRVRIQRLLAPLGVAVALAVVLLLLPGEAGAFFRFKLFNLFNIGSSTAVLRLATYTLALQQTLDHLVIGWGTFSFAPLAAQGNDFRSFENWRNLWIGDYLLLALHDTGIAGLVMWIGLLWSVIRGGLRTARTLHATDPAFAARTFALTAAVVSMLIPFLATSGFSLGYPWLLIGLLGAHARLAADAAPAIARSRIPIPVGSPLPADAT